MTEEELVVNNMKFVHHIVHNHYPNAEYDDAVSAGYIGLIKAAKKFDASKGFKFSTFAYPCITNEINMQFRVSNRYTKLQPVSGDAIAYTNADGSQLRLFDMMENGCDTGQDVENKMLIEDILSRCSPKEKTVLALIMQGNNQREIGEYMGFSQSYVNRILKNTVNYIEPGKRKRRCKK